MTSQELYYMLFHSEQSEILGPEIEQLKIIMIEKKLQLMTSELMKLFWRRLDNFFGKLLFFRFFPRWKFEY